MVSCYNCLVVLVCVSFVCDYLLTFQYIPGELSVHISIGPFGPKRTYIYPSRAA
jgi:hypothetical protein